MNRKQTLHHFNLAGVLPKSAVDEPGIGEEPAHPSSIR